LDVATLVLQTMAAAPSGMSVYIYQCDLEPSDSPLLGAGLAILSEGYARHAAVIVQDTRSSNHCYWYEVSNRAKGQAMALTKDGDCNKGSLTGF